MLTYSQAFYELKSKLQPLYDEREAAAIAHEVMEDITGLGKTGRLLQKDVAFTEIQQRQYEEMGDELQKGVPLQYVVGHAWFMGRQYKVNKYVLIPRPETEELVQWIVEDFKIQNSNPRILDIGAGSGCIAISLKLALPEAWLTSCDVSSDALNVAEQNAKLLKAEIELVQLDFLQVRERNKLGRYNVIVSNPPYIPASDRAAMHTNVKDHEPGIALFVPDDNALVFYKAIAAFGREHLKENGYIYCELDAGHAEDCKRLFEAAGYKNVEIKKDMHGKWRMLKCEQGNR